MHGHVRGNILLLGIVSTTRICSAERVLSTVSEILIFCVQYFQNND